MEARTDFSELINLLKGINGKAYVLCDENTYKHCYDVFSQLIDQRVHPIVIKAGEVQKSIVTCNMLWQKLLKENADKNALLINLGGGVVSDIGGFVAATYKRGVKYVNVPTSLLAMVDAATGGKTGVNFEHFKNIIGIVQQPEIVMLHTPFLNTLPKQQLKNGFAEMLKHALLSSKELTDELLTYTNFEVQIDENGILKSLAYKESIVAEDPTEKGIRKVLNFGHTIGHALEFAAQENGHEILHGEAVAFGMLAALKLSIIKMNFNENEAKDIIKFISDTFPVPTWIKDNKHHILNAILQDKKNSNQEVRMVLLKEIGKPVYDINCSLKEIEQVLFEDK